MSFHLLWPSFMMTISVESKEAFSKLENCLCLRPVNSWFSVDYFLFCLFKFNFCHLNSMFSSKTCFGWYKKAYPYSSESVNAANIENKMVKLLISFTILVSTFAALEAQALEAHGHEENEGTCTLINYPLYAIYILNKSLCTQVKWFRSKVNRFSLA